MISTIKNLSLVSVRDYRTKAFLLKLTRCGDLKIDLLPDPTFSLPLPSAAYLNRLKELTGISRLFKETKTVLLMSHSEHKFLADLVEFCRKVGYSIATANPINMDVEIDISAIGLSPLEWANLTACADLVITDRFHGVASALRQNIPVIAVDHRQQLSGNDSKIADLLTNFDLRHHCISTDKFTGSDLEKAKAIVANLEWPRSRVSQKSLENARLLGGYVTDCVPNIIA